MPLILKFNVRSRTPDFAYINAPPAPYKGMQPQDRVQTESTGNAKARHFLTVFRNEVHCVLFHILMPWPLHTFLILCLWLMPF